jgi:segregation and condensation protein B
MSELAAIIQALLFAASDPLPLAPLVEASGYPEEDVRAALDELTTAMETTGLRLQHHLDRWQLVTAPTATDAVARLLQAEARSDLSRAALETLAIIAYRGPLTRESLDGIRGVGSETMIRNLLGRGLVIEHDRASEPGRPVRYHVSERFLQHVGLTSLTELPPLDETADNEA